MGPFWGSNWRWRGGAGPFRGVKGTVEGKFDVKRCLEGGYRPPFRAVGGHFTPKRYLAGGYRPLPGPG